MTKFIFINIVINYVLFLIILNIFYKLAINYTIVFYNLFNSDYLLSIIINERN